MKKLAIFSMAALTAFACATSANAALTVVFDEDFSSNALPAGFTATGTPSFAGGVMTLDGSSYIQQAGAPTTNTDDIVLETIVSASSVGTFNFVASISEASGSNSGYGLLAQSGDWHALTSLIGFPGSTAHGAAPTPTVALAFVRVAGDSSLYVNGAQFDSGGSDGGITLTDAGVLTIGGHEFDAPAGLFNGTVDRVRVSTITGQFSASDLLGPNDGTIPEPASMALMGLGGLLMLRRRRSA